MEILVENKSKKLVQVTDGNDGITLGLYLLPVDISFDDFEKTLENAESQENFDDNNSLGAERIYVYDAIIFPKKF